MSRGMIFVIWFGVSWGAMVIGAISTYIYCNVLMLSSQPLKLELTGMLFIPILVWFGLLRSPFGWFYILLSLGAALYWQTIWPIAIVVIPSVIFGIFATIYLDVFMSF